MKLDRPDEAIIVWFRAFQFNDYRIENLYEIVKYYCRNSDHKLAYHLYLMTHKLLQTRPQKDDVLFFKKSVYEYLLDFEFTICANYYNPYGHDILALYMKIFKNTILDYSTKRQLLSNLKFEPTPLTKTHDNSPLFYTVFNTISNAVFPPTNATNMDTFVSSTPTIAYNAHTKELFVNIRYVNYKINPANGDYLRENYVGTKNLFIVTSATTGDTIMNKWLQYDTTMDNEIDGYAGLEDIRFSLVDIPVTIHDPFANTPAVISNKTMMVYNCNRGIQNTGKITVECGIIQDGGTINGTQFTLPENTDVEKNWSCFFNGENRCKFVYKWGENGMMVIGEKDATNNRNTLVKTHYVPSPPIFADLRGSTNGVTINGEIWFICHLVSHEERRFYYHCFVVIDPHTYNIKRYSRIWTFERNPIEYCLSFIHNRQNNRQKGNGDTQYDTLIIGYSVADATAKCTEITLDYAMSLCDW
jgi:hypothetical protein